LQYVAMAPGALVGGAVGAEVGAALGTGVGDALGVSEGVGRGDAVVAIVGVAVPDWEGVLLGGGRLTACPHAVSASASRSALRCLCT